MTPTYLDLYPEEKPKKLPFNAFEFELAKRDKKKLAEFIRTHEPENYRKERAA